MQTIMERALAEYRNTAYVVGGPHWSLLKAQAYLERFSLDSEALVPQDLFHILVLFEY